MTLAEAIRNRLIDSGAEDVFIIDAPAPEEPCIVVSPYMSEPEDSAPFSWESFQIRASGYTYPDAEKRGWDAYKALVMAKLEGADRRCLSHVIPQSEPVFIGKDPGGMYVTGFNIRFAATYKGDE